MASGWKWAVWKPEARSFLRVFHLVVGAQVLGRFPLLSQVISRVLDWKSIIEDSNWCPFGMLAPQEVALYIISLCQTLHPQLYPC